MTNVWGVKQNPATIGSFNCYGKVDAFRNQRAASLWRSLSHRALEGQVSHSNLLLVVGGIARYYVLSALDAPLLNCNHRGVKHFFHSIDDLCKKSYFSLMLVGRILAFFGILPRRDGLAEALGVAMREACSQMAREAQEGRER
jgi:hypothetical protein